MQATRAQWSALWRELAGHLDAGLTAAQMRTTNATGRHSEHIGAPEQLSEGRLGRRRIAEWSLGDFHTRITLRAGLAHDPHWEVHTASEDAGALGRHAACVDSLERARARLARRGGKSGAWLRPEPAPQPGPAALAPAPVPAEPETTPAARTEPARRARRRPRGALALAVAVAATMGGAATQDRRDRGGQDEDR